MSGETIKFNTEVTNGAPYISCNSALGSFVISKPGKYVINVMLYATNAVDGSKTQMILELNGVIVTCHDLIFLSDAFAPFAFTDVIQINGEHAALRVLNSGKDIILNNSAEAVAGISLWGPV